MPGWGRRVNQSLSSSRKVISHHGALCAVNAALAHAEALGIHICVAVIDSGGTLAGFARMPKAFLLSGDVAMRKAQSTAAVGMPSETVEQAIEPEAPRVREGLLHGGFTFIRGGLPLFDGDAIVGAIGVSGGSEAQDVECAQAGVAALKR